MKKEALRAQGTKIRKEEELLMLEKRCGTRRDDAETESGEDDGSMRSKKKRCDNERLGSDVFSA